MIRILGICGSPRKQGNSAYATRHALATLDTQPGVVTEYISLAGLNIAPCDGCFACRGGSCHHEDDMAAIYEALRRCEGLILASPVYLGLVTGPLQMVMDRTVVLRINGWQLSGKVGAGIACGGFRNGGQELTLVNMQTYFLQQNMLVIADGPRYSHSGATIVGRAEEDALGLQTVEQMALHLLAMVRR